MVDGSFSAWHQSHDLALGISRRSGSVDSLGLSLPAAIPWVDIHAWNPYAMSRPNLVGLAFPAYLMAARQFTPHWLLQLNIHNLLDQRYYQGIEATARTTYGAPRSFMLTLRYQH